MKRVRVRAGSRAYDVIVGSGVLDARHLRTRLRSATAGVVVSSRRVLDLHRATLDRALRDCGFTPRATLVLRDGEAAKSASEWERMVRAFARAGLDRRSVVIAFGGGSVGDAAGFAAATYARGIPFIQIPTTLLSMVDSSVGGKTGINLVEGKNLVGAFHQPDLVLADTSLLRTLPDREKQSGAYEILKCALLKSPALFALLRRTHGLRRASMAQLEHAIAESVRIKARIVERDEHESGERMLLNLGHTFGHGLEAATGYRVLTHGEAVGYGLDFAADYGVSLGFCEEAEAAAVRASVASLGPRVSLKAGLARTIQKSMARDKKRDGASVREVFVSRAGRPRIERVPFDAFAKAAAAWIRKHADAL